MATGAQSYAITVVINDAFATATNTALGLALTKQQYQDIVTAAIDAGLHDELIEAQELERLTKSNFNNLITYRNTLDDQNAPAGVVTAAERAVWALYNQSGLAEFLDEPSFPDPDA